MPSLFAAQTAAHFPGFSHPTAMGYAAVTVGVMHRMQ
jgi:hypothetical protein